MIITITDVESAFTKNGDEFKKVKGVTDKGQETTKSIFNNLQNKWGLLEENATIDLKLEKKGQFWNVVDVLPCEFPEPQEPVPPENYPDKEVTSTATAVKEPVSPTAETPESTEKEMGARKDDRNASFALSYSKDICVAALTGGHIKIGEARTFTCTLANSFLDWLNNE